MTPNVPLRLAAVIASLTLVAACGSGDSTGDPATAATVPSDVAASVDGSDLSDPVDPHPLLRPDGTTHLGLSWFSPPDPASAAVIGDRWNETQEAASVGRVLIDWIDVEPERGEYRIGDLDEAIAGLTAADLAPMVTIAATDVSGTPFPEWLGGFEPVDAADAYVEMIEAILPTLRSHDVWLLAIANEPPIADDELDIDEFATFVGLVVDGAEQVAPDLAVTFTFAGGDPFIDDPAIDRMIDAVDVFSVNHYCLENDLVVQPLAVATDRIDALIEKAGDLPVVFQEFGCPAGAANGSSEADQLAWFEVAFDHIGALEQVRAAFVFEFLDWSEATFELDYGPVLGVLEDEIGADFVERFRSWLLTSGLVRADGSTRPAYDLFLETATG